MNNNSKHRGKIIKNVFKEKKINLSDFTRKKGIERTTVYNYFATKELSWDKILELGKDIDHDFSREFPELIGFYKTEFNYEVNEQTDDIEVTLKYYQNETEKYKQLYENLKKSYRDTMRKLKAINLQEIENEIENKPRE